MQHYFEPKTKIVGLLKRIFGMRRSWLAHNVKQQALKGRTEK